MYHMSNPVALEVPPRAIQLRLLFIRQGLEAELEGYRLTAKAPRCFKIIKDEFGIKVNPRDKVPAYLEFCQRSNQLAKHYVKQADGKYKVEPVGFVNVKAD